MENPPAYLRRATSSLEDESFMDGSGKTRRLASAMLCLAAVMQTMGFVLCFVEGLMQFIRGKRVNFMGEPFASGFNYWPLTVSEMIHNPLEPQGQLFRAFALAVAMLLLVSAYPWNLANVYLGGVSSWAQELMVLRHIAPPLGLIILSQVPVTPGAQATVPQRINIYVHLFGAMAMFGTYLAVEGYTLRYSPKRTKRGRQKRCAVEVLLMVLAPTFLVMSYISDASGLRFMHMTDGNTYRVPTEADLAKLKELSQQNVSYTKYYDDALQAKDDGKPLLYDTAHGVAFALRVATYTVESMLGVCMSISMLFIWYHCKERRFQLPERLRADPNLPDSDESAGENDDSDDGSEEEDGTRR
mmetsp:Transcript_69628/g.168418  ORF Transcript_69628/g.168418 Transcript_69628/m.168418 type:complete len:357 (-) Transcript_69628:378-1448(-)